jgi:hypothetical protein
VDVPLSNFKGYDFNIKELKFDQGGDKTFHFDNIFFTSESSLETNDLAQIPLKIFPNPSADFWTIETKKTQVLSLILFDAMGKCILSLNPKDTKIVIDGSALQTGLYFASLKTETGVNTFKLIKK